MTITTAGKTHKVEPRRLLTGLVLGALLLLSCGSLAADQQPKDAIHPPKVIFFDVIETLLDLQAISASAGKALDGRTDLVPLWFATMLQYSMVDTLTGNYSEFADIGAAALQMVAAENKLPLTQDEARAAIRGPIRTLPPHQDVEPGLKKLKEMGFVLVTLTNSSEAGVSEQMRHAGLEKYFDRYLSIGEIKKYKPDLEVYKWAMAEMGVAPENAMLFAAHHWDLMGGAAAGMQTVFVTRPGRVLYPLGTKPDVTVSGVEELAEKLAATKD